MTETLNREDIVALLQRLGVDDDAEVLEAARALHTAVTDAGVGWDELMAPQCSSAATAEAASDQPKATPTPGDDQKALALIEKLLARPGITDDFRREMEAYKSDIAEGTFADDDHRYLIALDKRLAGAG